jgi:hypothetical protein
MWHRIIQSWREILGWILIIFVTLHGISVLGGIPLYETVERANAIRLFDLTTAVLALVWLWANKRKV